MWTALTIIAVITLLFFWRGPNAVWGGGTFGVIIGLVVAIVFAISGNGFHWSIIGKSVVIGILIGVLAEGLGKLSDYMKRSKR